jgi:hypothetical protein
MTHKLRPTINRIDEGAWIPIRHPNAVFDENTGQ